MPKNPPRRRRNKKEKFILSITADRFITARIISNNQPSPWIIEGPLLPGDFYEARAKGVALRLTIHPKSLPALKREIELSQVRIKKTETPTGISGMAKIEEWPFSAFVQVNDFLPERAHGRLFLSQGKLPGRIKGRLYFDQGRLTGEIIALIPLPRTLPRDILTD